jgi:hypothetical protein
MMRRLVLLAVLVVVACAQEKSAQPPPPRVTQVFTVKNANPQQVSNTLRTLGYQSDFDRRLGMIVVSAERSAMSSIAEVIQKLDSPAPSPKNVEITMFVLEAAAQGGQSGPIPAGLEPVTKQMQTMFGYQSFRVMDAPIMRGREGENTSTSGVLMLGGKPMGYGLRLRPGVIVTGKEPFIRLEALGFNLHSGMAGMNISISTEGVEFAAGQMAVIGKTGLEGERTLLLVVTGRIID